MPIVHDDASQPVLSAEQVTKRYGDLVALAPTDLHVPAGCTTVLIGPSGSGKSTLLRALIGLIQPDGGTVRFHGEPLSATNLLTVRRKMGYVIQEGGLFPHLTARANVTLLARQSGWSSTAIAARVTELADLTHFPASGLDRYPAQLSGGQRQRVSLMRALMLDPEVLLLDEPLGALDPMIRAGLQDELRAIFENLHKTVVLVTHDLNEAGFFGDVIVLMRRGGIVQKGRWPELTHQPADAFVQAFVHAQRREVDEMKHPA